MSAALAEAVGARLGPGYAPGPAQRRLSDSPDGRRVTELRFRRRDRSGHDVRVIVKQFAGNGGSATYAAMKALEAAAAGAGAGTPLWLPRALWYDARLRTLGLEPATGRSYRELVREDGIAAHLELVGGALASLHALDVPQLRATTIDDHIAELIRPSPEGLAAALPEHGALVTGLAARLRADGRRVAYTPAPVHRDFHLGQLFGDGDRVGVIDWDLVARGDPALDVGNFAVYLRVRAPEIAGRGVDAFLAGYTARAGTGALARLPLYEALTCLRLACKRVRLKPPGWRDEVARLLGMARARLD
jgi:hypothetical protein